MFQLSSYDNIEENIGDFYAPKYSFIRLGLTIKYNN